MKFVVITIDKNGEIFWISQCKTRQGAERSANYSKRLSRTYTTKVLAVEDIIAWHDSGVAELEAMFRL